MVSQIKVNEIIKQSGSSITIGESGDTITLPSTATLTNFPDNTPAWHARLSSDQGVADSTNTVINFNTEVIDTDSAYNTSNGRFTVPSNESGKYYVYAQLMRNNFVNSRYLMKINVNGTSLIASEQRNSDTGGTTFQTVNAAGILDLSVGDYVDVSLFQNSGSSDNGANGGSSSQSLFMGYKLIGL